MKAASHNAEEAAKDRPTESVGLPNQPREDLVESFAGLHQNNLYLSLIFSDSVGDSIFGFPVVEVMRAKILEWMMQCRGALRRASNFLDFFLDTVLKGGVELLVQTVS